MTQRRSWRIFSGFTGLDIVNVRNQGARGPGCQGVRRSGGHSCS